MPSPEQFASLNLADHGAQLYAQAFSSTEIERYRALCDAVLGKKAGERVFGGAIAAEVEAVEGPLRRISIDILGAKARPVRAILFGKNEHANWSVGWHQDRTISVRSRRDADGYGPWSVKGGAIHVEPPFEVLSAIITMRAHFDDCDEDNAPLLIAPGSHHLGRVRVANIDEVATRLGTVRCIARAGDIWAYATPVVHASEPAKHPRRRRVLQVDFSARELPAGLEWLGIGARY